VVGREVEEIGKKLNSSRHNGSSWRRRKGQSYREGLVSLQETRGEAAVISRGEGQGPGANPIWRKN